MTKSDKLEEQQQRKKKAMEKSQSLKRLKDSKI